MPSGAGQCPQCNGPQSLGGPSKRTRPGRGPVRTGQNESSLKPVVISCVIFAIGLLILAAMLSSARDSERRASRIQSVSRPHTMPQARGYVTRRPTVSHQRTTTRYIQRPPQRYSQPRPNRTVRRTSPTYTCPTPSGPSRTTGG